MNAITRAAPGPPFSRARQVKITGACKLSHESFPYNDLWDPLWRIFDAFGFDRCMWGTDWTRAVALLTYE
jgi:predicted TIM-barrel fold metal-dependent hydrolase